MAHLLEFLFARVAFSPGRADHALRDASADCGGDAEKQDLARFIEVLHLDNSDITS